MVQRKVMADGDLHEQQLYRHQGLSVYHHRVHRQVIAIYIGQHYLHDVFLEHHAEYYEAQQVRIREGIISRGYFISEALVHYKHVDYDASE